MGSRMDTRTGDIIGPGRLKILREEFGGDLPEYLKEMKIRPTVKQLIYERVGRNDSCGCGSGKKFKKCCLQIATAADERELVNRKFMP